jgi:chromosome segregation ATPase
MAVSIQDYTRHQRMRLEALKAETERERALLSAHVHRHVAGPGSISPPRHRSPSGADASRSPSAPPPPPPLHGGGYSESRQSSAPRHHQSAALENELTLLREEGYRLDRRADACADRIRELRQKLSLVELTEVDHQRTLAELEARRRRLDERQRAATDAEREAADRVQLLSNETREREHVLEQARQKAAARASEEAMGVRRLRDAVKEAEERLRGMEAQLHARERTQDLAERELARSEMVFRDDELRSIEELRREIALRTTRSPQPA